VRFAADGLPDGWPQDHGVPTIGPDVLAWAETELVQPDGDMAGEPWQWRESQARFVCWWFAVDDTGDWLFRRGQIVLPKGTGKSPLAAALSCCELAGPVKFAGWDAGEPVARPHPSPWVQLAAVSQDQTDNTMSLVLAMLRGPAERSIRGLDAGITRVRTRSGVLQPVTASAPSREGQRTTAAILDETHLWTSQNGGQRLAATIRRNLAKMSGRSLETTNTWQPGMGSVAESTAEYADKVRAGVVRDSGVLRWHPMADVEDLSDEPTLRAALAGLYADAPWVDLDRIVAEVYDLGTHPSDARRYYLNQVATSDDAWLAQHEWAARADLSKVVTDTDAITLGFDGSRSRSRGITDATALIGCRVSDGHLFEIAVWEQPEGAGAGTWQVPTTLVDAAVRSTFERFNVVGFYADPAKWETFVASWEASYGKRLRIKATRDHPIEWWMTGGRSGLIVRALEQFHSAVVDGDMTHDGAFALSRHVLNARRRPTTSGIQIAKEHPDSHRKIDAAVAAVLAWQARLDALSVDLEPVRRSKTLHRF
jgi:phage terminase large subunit-like protein